VIAEASITLGRTLILVLSIASALVLAIQMYSSLRLQRSRHRHVHLDLFESLESERQSRGSAPPPQTRHIIVRVGKASSGDIFIERHEIHATDLQPLSYDYVWYHPDDPSLLSDDNFRVVSGTLNTTSSVEMELVSPANEASNRRRVFLLFQPPLRSRSVWELRVELPGFWNALRTSGSDRFFYTADNSGVEEVVLEFDLERTDQHVEVAYSGEPIPANADCKVTVTNYGSRAIAVVTRPEQRRSYQFSMRAVSPDAPGLG
jgi:hypothetical protein